jgi:hypothetical protein
VLRLAHMWHFLFTGRYSMLESSNYRKSEQLALNKFWLTVVFDE